MKINMEGLKIEIPGEGKATIDNLSVECSVEEFSKNIDGMVEIVNNVLESYSKYKMESNK